MDIRIRVYNVSRYFDSGTSCGSIEMIAERVSIGNYRGAYKVFHVAFSAMLILALWLPD
jgi:hypothetical protein